MLTNYTRKVLYIGVTNNLPRRIAEHYFNRGDPASFCGRFYCYWLVHVEEFQKIKSAIAREKELKGWKKNKKVELINKENHNWIFLNVQLFDYWPPENFN